MRNAVRQKRGEEEEESVFISMTDMTVGFLFIVIILLAFFATQISPEETVSKRLLDERDEQISELNLRLKVFEEHPDESENPIAVYNVLAKAELAALLARLRARISAIDDSIDVDVSLTRDALQFRGDGLFARAEDEPSSDGREKMEQIAAVLGDAISCFTFGLGSMGQNCNPNAIAINSIQIEGHTDSDGADIYNMGLGARRGASIYKVMVSKHPVLLGFQNIHRQPVLSVASYGKGRPIADERLAGGKDANRRIDIRFILFAPAGEELIPYSIEDLDRVRDLLAARGTR